jgi:hypothetical protein
MVLIQLICGQVVMESCLSIPTLSGCHQKNLNSHLPSYFLSFIHTRPYESLESTTDEPGGSILGKLIDDNRRSTSTPGLSTGEMTITTISIKGGYRDPPTSSGGANMDATYIAQPSHLPIIFVKQTRPLPECSKKLRHPLRQIQLCPFGNQDVWLMAGERSHRD